MNLGQLRDVLRTAEVHYRQDGRGDVADALSVFTHNLLRGGDSQTVAAFVTGVEKARKAAGVRSSSGVKRKR